MRTLKSFEYNSWLVLLAWKIPCQMYNNEKYHHNENIMIFTIHWRNSWFRFVCWLPSCCCQFAFRMCVCVHCVWKQNHIRDFIFRFISFSRQRFFLLLFFSFIFCILVAYPFCQIKKNQSYNEKWRAIWWHLMFVFGQSNIF